MLASSQHTLQNKRQLHKQLGEAVGRVNGVLKRENKKAGSACSHGHNSL